MNKVVFSHNSDEWETPIELYNKLNDIYNFNLDPCATKQNAKCNIYINKEINGLEESWYGFKVFCNPPYSNIKEWVKKFDYEFKLNGVEGCMLVPARTDTKWFHDYIYNKYEIEFIKGRLKFSNKGSAPFPSMIIHFRKRKIKNINTICVVGDSQ